VGDGVLVLGTGGAGGDATASGCCWSQGEHGRVRAGRLVATGGALGVLQHHTQSNLPYSLLLVFCVLCVLSQVTWAPTDTILALLATSRPRHVVVGGAHALVEHVLVGLRHEHEHSQAKLRYILVLCRCIID